MRGEAHALQGAPGPSRLRTAGLRAGQFLGAYLLGILLAVLTSPASVEAVGEVLVHWYLILAIPGHLLFYFYLEGPYLPFGAEGLAYWSWFALGLVPLLGELVGWFHPRLRLWRPLWLGLPIGYVGTLGVFFTLMASV